jgi:hypothetical protein
LKFRIKGSGDVWTDESDFIDSPVTGDEIVVSGIDGNYEGAMYGNDGAGWSGVETGPGNFLYFSTVSAADPTEEAIVQELLAYLNGTEAQNTQIGRNIMLPNKPFSALIRPIDAYEDRPSNIGAIWVYPIEVFLQDLKKGTRTDKERMEFMFDFANQLIQAYHRQRIASVPKHMTINAVMEDVDDADRNEIGLTSDQVTKVRLEYFVWRPHAGY